MNQLKATPGVWKQSTGIGYCCIRTGSMNDKTGGVIADMRLVDGVYNPFDACLIAAAPDLYNFLDAKAHHLPIEDQHVASLLLAKARGEQS